MTKSFTERDIQGDTYILFVDLKIYLISENLYCSSIDRFASLEDELNLKAEADAPDMEESQEVENG